MPIPEDVEPGTPQADARLLEFIERRRQREVRDRRQRLQLAAIACLGVIVLILTISNAVLLSRLLARPLVPPALAPQPTVRRAPSATPTSPPVSEPSASPSPAARIPDTPPPAAPEPDAAATLPERNAPRAVNSDGGPDMAPKPPDVRRPPAQPGRGSIPHRHETPARAYAPAAVAGEADPVRRTARWLVESYGPLEAESRALAAAEFYSSDEREFWRRVAAQVHESR